MLRTDLKFCGRLIAAQPFATKERYGCGVPLAGAAPTAVYRKCSVGADIIRPVQELPDAYKPVRFLCLPLRGRMGHAPSLQVSIATVL